MMVRIYDQHMPVDLVIDMKQVQLSPLDDLSRIGSPLLASGLQSLSLKLSCQRHSTTGA
jgi:hypothetical protein